MGRSEKGRQRIHKKALTLSVWLYRLLLHCYPAPFRQSYGERLVRVFHDACRASLAQRGGLALLSLWGRTCFDLAWTACGEHWQYFKEKVSSMATSHHPQQLPTRLWLALIATLLAFGVSLAASLNLYLLEDGSPFTQAAYTASPLLRFSYDTAYLSALAAGVAVCAVVGYALVRQTRLIHAGLGLLTLLVAFGGFGGLLVRRALTFWLLFAGFLVLTLGGFGLGQVVAARLGRVLGPRSATVLGACVSVGAVLLINLVALVLHTLALNPVSHQLYMQGQIPGTHFNFSLIAMGLTFVTVMICLICLIRALQPSSRRS